MRIKHPRYEFVIEDTKESFAGDSIEEIYDKFIHSGIAQNDSGLNPDDFFKSLQDSLVGTWKWYNNKINITHWRRDCKAKCVIRLLTESQRREKNRKNIAKSHEARRNNPELAKAIAYKAGAKSASKAGKIGGKISGSTAVARGHIKRIVEARLNKYKDDHASWSMMRHKHTLKDNPDMQIIPIEEYLLTEKINATNVYKLSVGKYTFARKRGEHDADLLICVSKPSDEWEYCTTTEAKYYIRRIYLNDDRNICEFGNAFSGKVFIEKE